MYMSYLRQMILAAAVFFVSFASGASTRQDESLANDRLQNHQHGRELTRTRLLINPAEQATVDAERAMQSQRALYRQYFAEAYCRYPQIPSGVLEALAYTKTRWNNQQPLTPVDSHHGMPQPYGVMGLFIGSGGFEGQVDKAASLLNVSPAVVIKNQRYNILGAAALIAYDMQAEGVQAKSSPEKLSSVLENALGLSTSNRKASAAVDKHLRTSFAYHVLLNLNRGSDDKGIRYAATPIAFEKAFSAKDLILQRAPFVSLDVARDKVSIGNVQIDPITETLVKNNARQLKSADFAPALYRQSPFEGARTQGPPTHISIHQMEGFYEGSIATFLTGSAQASAHYLIRDSDGQVTQMVQESRRANHTFRNNEYTLGIEQEGFNGKPGWYSANTYAQVIAITKSMCTQWSISCSSVYRGASTNTENIQAASLRIKGHQHYSGQGGNRKDPGSFFSWTRFADGIAATSTNNVLDGFELDEGRFNSDPTASGSTIGISSSSTAVRNSDRVKAGSWSMQLGLKDDPASAANWSVRFLSGGGTPSANTLLPKAGGRLGAWVYSAAPGVSVQMAVDDSDGTERSTALSIPANAWTFVEWKLDDQAQWDAWAGASNGMVTATNVTLDSIFFNRTQNTTSDVFIYIDDVSFRVQ
jgi:N-acetyl-anhydromuramyl-L-alanine amidase AmpD